MPDQASTTPDQSEAELLAEYRLLLDLKDEQNAAVKATNDRLNELESKLRAGMESRGQFIEGAKTGIAGLTLTVNRKWFAKYDPALWPKIVEWAGTQGMAHLVQRRLNDKAVMELVDSGKGLPEGLGVESVLDLQFRRS